MVQQIESRGHLTSHKIRQETHHEMRISERDDLLSVNLFALIHRSLDIYG